MPSLSTPPPITEVNSTFTSDRRAASRKQASSVTAAPWPLVTRAAYQRIVQGDAAAVGDKGLRGLACARAKLGETLLLIDAASRHYNPQRNSTPDAQVERAPIYNKLRALHEQVEKLWKGFPLEVR